MRLSAVSMVSVALALSSGCVGHAERVKESLLQFEGGVPDGLVAFFADARTGKSALDALSGIPDESLRCMSNAHLASLLSVLDDFEGDGSFSTSTDQAALAKQVFRVLAAHMGPEGAAVTEVEAYQQVILYQDPNRKLSPTDQGHVRAILTRMPNEANNLIRGLRWQDQDRISNWSTRQLEPGDVKGLLDYVHAVSGTKASPGSKVLFISDGGMEPDLPPGIVRPDLQATLSQCSPDSDKAQDVASQLREVPYWDGEPIPMKVTNPRGALPRLLASIQKAEPSGPPVWLNVFAFQSDDTGWKIARAMADAKHRGCDVRLAYDPCGSSHSNNYIDFLGQAQLCETDPRIYEFLRDNGVPTLPFPVGTDQGLRAQILQDYCSHVKDYVAGSDLYMGGRNAGDEYYAIWQDASFQLNGPAVADGQKVFADVWNYSVRELLRRERKAHGELNDHAFENYIRRTYGDLSPISQADLQKANKSLAPVPGASTDPNSSPTVILHWGHRDRNSRETQMAAAEFAVHRYGIETPYGSEPGMAASLIIKRVAPRIEMLRRASRNVRNKDAVEAIFPAFNDEPLLSYAMGGYYEELLDAGVKVYEYIGKPMNHSKLEVADDVVVAGSSNMDARSWQDNNENIFIIHDKALADAVWARFEDDKRHSVGITPEVLKQRDKGLVGAINVWLSDFLRGRWIGELL